MSAAEELKKTEREMRKLGSRLNKLRFERGQAAEKERQKMASRLQILTLIRATYVVYIHC